MKTNERYEFTLAGERNPLYNGELLEGMQDIAQIIGKIKDIEEMEPLPIPDDFIDEETEKSLDLISKRIAIAKKAIRKNKYMELSATELNQLCRFLGWPVLAGFDLKSLQNMFEEYCSQFGVNQDASEFTWDGVGFDDNLYEEDVDYAMRYDEKYVPTTVGLFQKTIDRKPNALDEYSEIRLKINDFISNEDLLISALPCDINCFNCPEARLKVCYFHNHDLVEDDIERAIDLG